MSESIFGFLVNGSITLIITIVTGSLVIFGLLFEVGWHARQRMNRDAMKGVLSIEAVEEKPKQKEGVGMAMIDPKWVSLPISEIRNEMRSFHERMNKWENDMTIMKEAMVKITEGFHQRR